MSEENEFTSDRLDCIVFHAVHRVNLCCENSVERQVRDHNVCSSRLVCRVQLGSVLEQLNKDPSEQFSPHVFGLEEVCS